jgi:hypothetical protein
MWSLKKGILLILETLRSTKCQKSKLNYANVAVNSDVRYVAKFVFPTAENVKTYAYIKINKRESFVLLPV